MNIEFIKTVIKTGTIEENVPMSRHTTFRTGGPAKCFVTPGDMREAADLINLLKGAQEEYFILGNGSNMLVSDKGYDGTVIDLGKHEGAELSEITVTERGDDIFIRAGAGALLSTIGAVAAEHSASGFEELSGIPGCLGGALIMNAGAYGGEIKDVVDRVIAIDPEGELCNMSSYEVFFRYRGSSLMDEGYVVLGAVLKLHKGDQETIRARMNELMEQRKAKQPLEYPSAGSTFKRPQGEGLFAGKMISDAGLKGVSVGGAMVSEKHAGFVINAGGASSSDIYALMKLVQQKVYEMNGIMLEPEVRLLGEFDGKTE